MIDDICDHCGRRELSKVYVAPDTIRNLSVMVCENCSLVQSLPRLDRATTRLTAISAGANWGNIRYGKGFRTEFAINYLNSKISFDDIGTVLDIGSNRGSFIIELNKRFPKLELWGVEPDINVVGDYVNNPAIRLISDRIENVNLPLNYFDFIYCSHTLEHLASPSQFLKNIRKSLTGRRFLFIEVPNLSIIEDKTIMEEFFIDKHLYHFTTHTLTRVLISCGYRIVHQGSDSENIFVLATPDDLHSEDLACIDSEDVDDVKRAILNYTLRMKSNLAGLLDAAQQLSKLCMTDKVCVWGAGRIFDAIVSHGEFDPKLLGGLIDSELYKYVEAIHGVTLSSPVDLPSIAPTVLIIASRTYYEEIKKSAQTILNNNIKIYSLFDLMEPLND